MCNAEYVLHYMFGYMCITCVELTDVLHVSMTICVNMYTGFLSVQCDESICMKVADLKIYLLKRPMK